MIDTPHIGNILKTYIQKNRLYQSAWARDAALSTQTVAKYLKQPTMRIDTLFAICQQLNHNFLREIADTLPANLPPTATTNNDALVQQLQTENEQLKLKVATLENAIKLFGGK